MPEKGMIVQCENCLIWFHEDCVDIPQKEKGEKRQHKTVQFAVINKLIEQHKTIQFG